MCQSKESEFTIAADATAWHVSLSQLVFSCYAAYQLESTAKFLPLLQGCQQSLVIVSHSTLPLIPLRLCCVWEVRYAGHIPSREEQLYFPLCFSYHYLFIPSSSHTSSIHGFYSLPIILRVGIYPGFTSDGRRDVFVWGNYVELL